MKNKILILSLLLILNSCKDSGMSHDASGSFEAVETIISAEANGQLLQLNMEEGQELTAGQIIGYIDSTQLYARKLQLLQSKKAILSGRPQTRVQTEALKKELANAVLDRDRTENLVKGGVATQKQLDDANARVTTLQAKISAQESSLQTTTSSLNEQAATVDAQLTEVNDLLKKCVLTNPLKGTILTKYAEQFEITAAGKPLYKIADLSSIILRAYITGDQLSKIKLDQKVKVFTDDGKGGFKETEGVVTWINDKAEFTPKTIQTKNERANLVYAIKVKVRNDGSYKIGMYGELGL
ncbi:MAG: efflux RND transporter periplasmic adaptor subunit [Cyclobacteriaceae bacterium]|jgi:HlyD family secretion protein|nr:efflux RND transporter periplasmic adaptor subunit [Cyclobacteriaceae bacterium]